VRSDNDSWDITTSVGSTALFVAAARGLEAQKPTPAVVDEYAEVFCRAAGGMWADVLDGKPTDLPLTTTDFGEYFVNYLAARTHYFDGYFAAAADAGVRQIVLLAAGLDSRAYRLAWPAGTVVFELDRREVLDFKGEALAACGATPSADRREIAVDLREDWPQALQHSGFDADAPSAWIAEGLLIYLPASAQGELFSSVDALAAQGSHIAVEDTVPLDTETFALKRRESLYQTADGNNFFTLTYNERHAVADQWLAQHGWDAAVTPLNDYLRSLGRPLPAEDSDAAAMSSRISLVRGVKS
jgi:methyltransferase (TIGR00027 family)